MTQTLTSEWGQEPLTVDSIVPTVALRHHLGRVHVGTPVREVLRETRDAIRKAPKRQQVLWTREIRKQTLAAAAWLHTENRAEYAAVMGGRV